MLKLKVINIDSLIELTPHDCAFTEQVIFMAEDLDKTEKRWNSENSISPLLAKIPVFLLKSKSMPDSDFDEESFVKETPPAEYFGFYTKAGINWGKKKGSIPGVFICPERIARFSIIRRAVHNPFLTYQEVLADVIIHEFAHAIMDCEFEHKSISSPKEFYSWVEEPFANWFVLKYFENYGNGGVFRRVIDSMKHEPDKYKLGLNFFYSNISDKFWQRWKKTKSEGIGEDSNLNWVPFAKNVIKNNLEGKEIVDRLNELLKS